MSAGLSSPRPKAKPNKSPSSFNDLSIPMWKDFSSRILDLGLVLPSVNSFEAFGIVQLEAMNNGVPVVASNIKGVRSIIKNTQNGYLFQKNNYNELAKILIKIQKFKIKNHQSISENVNAHYSYKLFFEKIKQKISNN